MKTLDSLRPCVRPMAGIRLAAVTVTFKSPFVELLDPDAVWPRFAGRLNAAGVETPRSLDFDEPGVRDAFAIFDLLIATHSSGYIAGDGLLLVGRMDVSREALVRVDGRHVPMLAGFADHQVVRVVSRQMATAAVAGMVDELADAILATLSAADAG